MAKDYSKLKALAQQMIECIGDEPEGENPSLPKPDTAEADGGQDVNTSFMDDAESGELPDTEGDSDMAAAAEPENKKKRKDLSLSFMASTLASKFNKQD